MTTAILVALALFAVFAFYVFKKGKSYDFAAVKIGENTVNVEVANTPTSRAKGLMYKEEMGANEGMLFVFPTEAKHRFWMANTYLALDIIWISADREIVHIEENVPPCKETGQLKAICTTYKPAEIAKYVLEVNGGWIAEKGVVVGDRVDLME